MPKPSIQQWLDQAMAAGLDRRELERLHGELNADVQDRLIPGAVLVLRRHGRVVFRWAWGWRDPYAGLPMREDSLFRIFSMTKPLASLAVLMLVEDGRVHLSDEAVQHLPGFKHRHITVEHLLLHTSGLTYGPRSGDPVVRHAYERCGVGINPRGVTASDLIAGLGDVPLVCPPGTRWEYGSSTDVLGVLVEAVTGVRLGTFLRDRVFYPLGMGETGFWVPPEQGHRVAQPYESDAVSGENLRTIDRWFDACTPPALESGGAGAISTADDYAKFGQWLLDRRDGRSHALLSPDGVRRMMQDHLHRWHIPICPGPGESSLGCPGFGFGYGLAIRMDGPAAARANLPVSPGTCLWSGTAGTMFWVDPQMSLVGVYMSQAGGARRVNDRRRVLTRVRGTMQT